ncbi:MAG TPA: hypothetical protein VF777_14565 [Phycisphaerales bacterium]
MSAVVLCVLAGTASAQLINRVQGVVDNRHSVEDAAALANADIAMAGDSYNFLGGFNSSATLTRAAADGVPIWHLTISEPNAFPSAFGVRETPSGNLVLGFYRDFGVDTVCLASISSGGGVNWVKRFPGSRGFPGSGMEIDTSSGPAAAIVASQYDQQAPLGGQLLRVDVATGGLVFNRVYTPSNPQEVNDVMFSDVVRTPGGDYFVTGTVTRLINGEIYDTDLFAARLHAGTGAVVWAKAIGTPLDPERGYGYETGRGIELATDGSVVVAGQINNPVETFGPDGGVHIRFDAATGAILAQSTILDVQVAAASVDRDSSGNMVISGTRAFGDGQGQPNMWLIDESTLALQWRREYNTSTSFGNDAVPHKATTGGYVLVGNHFSNNPIGVPDQMFIWADGTGDDGCTAILVEPIQPPVTLLSNDVLLTLTLDSRSFSYAPTVVPVTLSTNLACEPVGCVGDLNNDGLVDDADFVIFAEAYNILDCFDPGMTAGCPADLNSDGFVDDADFVIFADAYNQLLCP